MKLAYITSVALPSNAAQSKQILSMSAAFSSILKSNFILISYDNNKKNNKSSSINFNISHWIKISLPYTKKLQYFFFVFRALYHAKSKKCEYIYTRDIAVAIFGILFKFKCCYEIHKDPRSSLSKFIFFFIRYFKFLDKIKFIFISEALRRFYISNFNINNKCLVLHDAVFIDMYDKYRKISKRLLKKNVGLPNQKIMLHSGSIYPGRGSELFEIIIKNFPDILFIQIGGDIIDINYWSSRFKKYRNIRFIERKNVHDLVKYQMAADYLLYPLTKNCDTWWCCSPLKLFEYLATGIPIFSSNIGSINEVINSRCVFLFNPSKPSSLRDVFRLYKDNNLELKKRASIAVSLARKKYTWSRRAKSILDFISYE